MATTMFSGLPDLAALVPTSSKDVQPSKVVMSATKLERFGTWCAGASMPQLIANTAKICHYRQQYLLMSHVTNAENQCLYENHKDHETNFFCAAQCHMP
jgi:hypothetical protein